MHYSILFPRYSRHSYTSAGAPRLFFSAFDNNPLSCSLALLPCFLPLLTTFPLIVAACFFFVFGPYKQWPHFIGIMDFRVNGTVYHSANGLLSVKPLFGLQSVLAYAGTTTVSSLSAPLGQVVVAPVDAQGRFLVKQGETYSVTTFQSQEDYKALLTRKLYREQYGRYATQSKSKSKREPRPGVRRGPNRYTVFAGEFMKTFLNTAFTDAATAWRSLDPDARKTKTARELVNTLIRQGRYQLATSKIAS